jgi:hypothetical protein
MNSMKLYACALAAITADGKRVVQAASITAQDRTNADMMAMQTLQQEYPAPMYTEQRYHLVAVPYQQLASVR